MYLCSIFNSSCNKKALLLDWLIKKSGCDAQFNWNLLNQIRLVEWLIASERQADIIDNRENDRAFDVILQPLY